MNTFFDRFAEKLMPIADRLNRNRYLAAIRDGFFASMSIIIIGSMFLIFPNFPYQGFIDFMNGLFGDTWIYFCNQAYDMTVNVMVFFAIFGMTRSLAHYYQQNTSSFVSFFILTPIVTDTQEANALPFSNFGAAGLFLGIIVTILACEIVQFVLKKNWKLRLPDSVPTNVSASFESLVPAAFIVIIFSFINFPCHTL